MRLDVIVVFALVHRISMMVCEVVVSSLKLEISLVLRIDVGINTSTRIKC